MAKGSPKVVATTGHCNNLKIIFTVINLKRSFLDVGSLKRSFPDASLKRDFPGVNHFAFVFTSLKRSFPGVDNLEPGSGSTLGFTIPEVDSKMIPGVDNHGWSNFLVEMTPKSTVESL